MYRIIILLMLMILSSCFFYETKNKKSADYESVTNEVHSDDVEIRVSYEQFEKKYNFLDSISFFEINAILKENDCYNPIIRTEKDEDIFFDNRRIVAEKLYEIYQLFETDCQKIEFLYYTFNFQIHDGIYFNDKELDIEFESISEESGVIEHGSTIFYYEPRENVDYYKSLELDLHERLKELNCK